MSPGAAARPLFDAPRDGRPFDVVGIGQNSLDHVLSVDGMPGVGQKAEGLDYVQLPGGQVATGLLCCARLGLRASYVGTVGEDAARETVLAPLRDAGIDTSGVRVAAGATTQIGLILVDRASGERTVVWYRDPRLALSPADLRRESIESARLLYLDGGDPEAGVFAARVAREAGIPVVLDIDTVRPGVEALLDAVDFPIVSRSFAETYSKSGSVRDGLDRISGQGARLAVITLGEIGAIARMGDALIPSPGFRVDVRDTTGAGDVFHAAFAWALLEGMDAGGALRAANAAAALSCRALGAQGGHPDRAQLEAFLASSRPIAWRSP